MSATGTIIHLTPENFSEKEITLVENSPLSASTFRFDSGVSGIRLRNELGSLVLLPFQGQQIWSAEFHGRNLTMKSMFSQPRPTRQYLDTYGGFLLHCGATAMGVPTKDDSHPLHGELPNAPFQHAYLAVGEDERGLYLGAGGPIPAHRGLQSQLSCRITGQNLRWMLLVLDGHWDHQSQAY
jgi:hypothetical protein